MTVHDTITLAASPTETVVGLTSQLSQSRWAHRKVHQHGGAALVFGVDLVS